MLGVFYWCATHAREYRANALRWHAVLDAPRPILTVNRSFYV
ncbi:hypothetical protein ALP23_102317 [Pseudomonas syringae pv. apii]|uniref:Uncharacterized protein n=2 Tax=Pseudomonas syringae group TaxID=136849 RepID=A0A3M5X1C3_9PSED|nr:hypothetical protein PsyrB_20015 [Pseudomonas syringae pv. syringae B301D]EXL29828.1 hypothetical protein PssB301D_03970 [Pseudomonas syringae pv. syringae str. B301D-R]KOG04956.1 Uncharacterized protein ABJ98_5208 [Pseudomonas syringae pv. aceris]RMT29317.1 hypothetical protein ALP49_102644 [Pseudomonas syringae pv. solidagae]RMU76691.1 hypothetical protein ALP23_102317 [Pseudomonas syringae pv. apii]